jgi:GntR family transcriptional regulator
MDNIGFSIQPDSGIAASIQLSDRIRFAISSNQYPPGSQLPSIRQLAQWTGLHRNTIGKVYQQLKETGYVETRGGAGVFVKSPQVDETLSMPIQAMRQTVDRLVAAGYSLVQAKEVVLAEIEWRMRCQAQILVAVGTEDPGVGIIMIGELSAVLNLPIQTVEISEIAEVLKHTSAATIVTNRYYLEQVRKLNIPKDIRLFAVDIYKYDREIQKIRQLPEGHHVGIVSISPGILRVAESLIQSLRGDRLLVTTVLPQDTYRLLGIARNAHLIITESGALTEVNQAIMQTKSERIRPLEVLTCPHYIAPEAIAQLKLELGIHT